MQSYRFYLLDKQGKIQTGEDHICADDLAALDKAKELSGDNGIEIWQATRRVAVVKKDDEELNARDRHSL